MKVHELVSEYKMAKKHSDEAEAKKDEKHEASYKAEGEAKKHEAEAESEGEAKKHEAEAMCDEVESDEKSKKMESKKSNSVDQVARFNSLKSAYENGKSIEVESQFTSLRERVDMGRSRYGTSK
jgi:regulator of protease activity HflC (stomatin/prohibitin superfamily)